MHASPTNLGLKDFEELFMLQYKLSLYNYLQIQVLEIKQHKNT